MECHDDLRTALLSLSGYDNRLLKNFRDGRLCCPICCELEERLGYVIIEETDANPQETFPVESVFYQLPGGLDHHLREVHEKTFTEQNARHMSQDFVAQETLQNFIMLSSARQADKASTYIECTVYVEAEGPNEGETRADGDHNQFRTKADFPCEEEKKSHKILLLVFAAQRNAQKHRRQN